MLSLAHGITPMQLSLSDCSKGLCGLCMQAYDVFQHWMCCASCCHFLSTWNLTLSNSNALCIRDSIGDDRLLYQVVKMNLQMCWILLCLCFVLFCLHIRITSFISAEISTCNAQWVWLYEPVAGCGGCPWEGQSCNLSANNLLWI